MEISFNKKFYQKEAIEEAIEAYSNFADFTLSREGSNWKVTLEEVDSKYKDIIKDEFANYVLGTIKSSSNQLES